MSRAYFDWEGVLQELASAEVDLAKEQKRLEQAEARCAIAEAQRTTFAKFIDQLEGELETAEARCAELTEKGYAASKLLLDAHAETQAAEARCRRLEREMATDLIHSARACEITLEKREEWLADVDPAVSALVREHAGCSVGECNRCGTQAPLLEDTSPGWSGTMRCAWGCTGT